MIMEAPKMEVLTICQPVPCLIELVIIRINPATASKAPARCETALATSSFFENFAFPYGFHGAEEYASWLKTAGFQAVDARLIPKDMRHAGRAGLAGWIRTTWLPYTQRVPENLQEAFISELADRYLEDHPPEADGGVRVKMVRLEVQAIKPA